MTKGGLFHKIVEESAKKQLEGKGPDEYKTLVKELDNKWGSEASRAYLYQPITKEEQDKESLKPALESFAEWSKANPNKVVALEHKFRISIGGFQWRGKIDRVELTPNGDLVIIDYKTGGKNKRVTKVNESIQLNVYVMAVRAELQKKKPFKIKLGPNEDWKNKKIKTASFFYPEKDHEDVDTDGVALSKSATGKADGQWFDYQVNDTDVEDAKKKIEEYIKAIQNGEFEATPGLFTCKFCDFNDICEESEAK